MTPDPELLRRARARSWYHTLELAPGVTTDGWFDMRPVVPRLGLPARLDGLRCLDIGTWDGFWAFELERRGAAEVVALDLDDEAALDWPPRRRPASFPAEPRGAGFELAREIRGSRVRREVLSIYEATPDALGGPFDVVVMSFVALHLRDQFLALERIAGLCRGLFVLAEEHDRLADAVPFPVSRYRADRDSAVVFWLPSVRTWKRMLRDAGFDSVSERGRHKVVNPDVTVRQVVLHGWNSFHFPPR